MRQNQTKYLNKLPLVEFFNHNRNLFLIYLRSKEINKAQQSAFKSLRAPVS